MQPPVELLRRIAPEEQHASGAGKNGFMGRTELEQAGLRDYPTIYAVVAGIFADYSQDEISNVGRWTFTDRAGNMTYVMPGELRDVKGIKIIQSHPDNQKRGLPRSISTLTLFNIQTGQQLEQMDSTDLTSVKSAAESAVVLRGWEHAAQPENIRLGIVGGGPNAREHFETFTQLSQRRVVETRIYSPRTSGKQLVERLQAEHLDQRISFSGDFDDIVTKSNVVVLSTTSQQPLLLPHHLDGATDPKLIIALGFRDVATEILEHAAVVVTDDPRDYSRQDLPAGAYMHNHPGKAITIKDVVNQPHLLKQGTVVFVPFGLGIIDVAVGYHLLQNRNNGK